MIELGPGNVQTAVEAGRVHGEGVTEILLFVGIAGALKDMRLGDVVAASEVAYLHRAKIEGGERLLRQQVNRCSRILVQVARHTARGNVWQERLPTGATPTPVASVGQILSGEELVKDGAYRDELKRTFSDALAVENEGYGLSQVGGSTLRTLVIRGASDDADETKTDSDQKRAANSAAAFAAQMLLDYLRIVHSVLAAPAQHEPSPEEPAASARASEAATEVIETLRTDIDLIEDVKANVVTFASTKYDQLDDEGRMALCERLASELNDDSTPEGLISRRMDWFARSFAARAINEGPAADWDRILQSTPTGGAVMLAQPDLLQVLTPVVRRRVISGLVGAVDAPQAMSVARAFALAALARSGVLTGEERARAELAEDATSYDILREAGWEWVEMFRMLSSDLASGEFARQNAAVRFLQRNESPHLQDGHFEHDQQRELIRLIVSAGRRGAFGAQDATTVSQMSDWPTSLLAEAVWSDMTSGGSRLDMPRNELKTVLSAALLSGRLEVVLDELLQSDRGREVDPVTEPSAAEDREWLIRQGDKLPDEAKGVWSAFIDALYERVPRR